MQYIYILINLKSFMWFDLDLAELKATWCSILKVNTLLTSVFNLAGVPP